ncbi:hypothetical protein BD626DRAFT_168553 [Schizophyllum amplum]|uniref:Hydrophobin n=1 Tax=Schizophyllum amplum TaxID=97359 RepID=A0A550CQJ2_9AGAR|nr:hypothetical protein BD626DRAFT_168553 [Auriculariopsis ampla]
MGMKLKASCISLVVLLFISYAVSKSETNAERMRKGLAPLKPRNLDRASAALFPRQPCPSSPPDPTCPNDPSILCCPDGPWPCCPTGPVLCCYQLVPASDAWVAWVLNNQSVSVPADTIAALDCDVLPEGEYCWLAPTCCKDNRFRTPFGVSLDCIITWEPLPPPEEDGARRLK